MNRLQLGFLYYSKKWKEEADEILTATIKQKFLSGSFRVSPTGEKTLLAEVSIDPNRERMIKVMHEDNLKLIKRRRNIEIL